MTYLCRHCFFNSKSHNGIGRRNSSSFDQFQILPHWIIICFNPSNIPYLTKNLKTSKFYRQLHCVEVRYFFCNEIQNLPGHSYKVKENILKINKYTYLILNKQTEFSLINNYLEHILINQHQNILFHFLWT